MNTIKFTNFNTFKIPQTVILTKNNEKIVLDKVNKVKYYDKASKCYRHLPTVYTINNINYA